MGTIQNQTKIQVDFDQCTGRFALNARAAAETMSASYFRINLFRATALATCTAIVTCPAVIKFADGYLKVEKGIQTFAKEYWNEQKILWNLPAFSTCHTPWLTQKSSYPDFPFQVIKGDKSDLINPLEFSADAERDISLSLSYRNISSTAEVRHTGGFAHEWSVLWNK